MKPFISQNICDPIVNYGDIIVTISSEDIPASGGDIIPTVSASQTITYASGKTRLGDLQITKDPAVSAPSLGSTLKERTKIKEWNVNIVGEGEKSTTKTIDVFQEANEIINRESYRYSGGVYSVVSASGGSSTPTPITIICRATFTSGTTVDSYEEPYTGLFEKISGEGDVDQTTGKVTYNTRGETIGDEKTTIIHIPHTLTRSETPSFYLECKQEKNIIESLDLSKGSLKYTYDVVLPSGGTANLKTNGSCIYTITFSSGNITNNISSDIITKYYTVETIDSHKTFSWEGPKGTFTSLDTKSGSVTVSSKLNNIVGETSTTITLSEYGALIPKEEYSFLGQSSIISSAIQYNIDITQSSNFLISISIVEAQGEVPVTIFPVTGGTLYFRCKATYSSKFVETVNTGDDAWSLDESLGASMTISTDEYNTKVSITCQRNESEDSKSGSLSVKYNLLSDTIVLTQNPNTVTYHDVVISSFTADDISSEGGSIRKGEVSYSQLVEYADGHSEVITSGAEISYSDRVTASHLGSTIKDRSVVGQLTVTVSLNEKSASKTIDIYQVANKVEKVTIKGWNNTEPITNVSAAGLYDCWYEGWAFYTSQTLEIVKGDYSGWEAPLDWINLEAVPNTDVNAVAVDVLTRGKVVGDTRTNLLYFTYQGKTDYITFTQKANTVTYSIPEFLTSGEVNDIRASGGSIMFQHSSDSGFIQTASYSSGEEEYITTGGTWTVEGATNGQVTAKGLGETIKARTKIATVKETITVNEKSANRTIDVYQEANIVTKMVCDGAFSYPQISAKDTSATPTLKTPLATITFRSGSTKNLNSISDAPSGTTIVGTNTGGASRIYTLTEQKNGFNSVDSTSGVLSATNMERILGTRTSGTVSCLFSWKLTHNSEYGGTSVTGSNTTTSVCTQGPNEKICGDVNISGGTVPIIPASGGSVSSASGVSASQSINYTSGITDSGKVSISYNTVTASSKGTEISNQNVLNQLIITASGECEKSATKRLNVYQAGNYVTGLSLKDGSFSYPNIGPGDTQAFPSVTNPTNVYTYSSGATGNTTPDSLYGTLSGESPTYTLETVQNGFTAVDRDTGTLTATSYGTTVGSSRRSGIVTRYVKHTWTPTGTYNGAGTKSGSIQHQASCLQGSNSIESYSYGSWNITISANPATLPASGGTSTITATAERTKTPIYSSGSLGTPEKETATPTLSGSAPGFSLSGTTVTAEHRGTTEGGQRTIEITASYGGTSKKITITQLENYVDHYEYGSWSINLSAQPTSLPASGGTSKITTTCTRTKTPIYDSGSSGNSSTESATPSLSISGEGFSISGTTVTAENRANIPGSRRTATVISSYSGVSKSVIIEQEANTRSYSDITILSASTDKVPASGGTVESGYVSFEQTESFSSGYSQKLTTSTNIVWGVLVVSNLGTTEASERQVGVISVQVTLNGKSARKEDVPVIQEANTKSYDTEKGITISDFHYPEAPYAQTTLHPVVEATMPVKYTSGASQNETIPLSYMSYGWYAGDSGKANLSYASGSISWPYNDTYNWRTCQVKVTVSFQGKTAEEHTKVYQEAEIMRLYFENNGPTQIQLGMGLNGSDIIGNNSINSGSSLTWTLTSYQKEGIYDWNKMYLFGRIQSGSYPYYIYNKSISLNNYITLNNAWVILMGNAYPVKSIVDTTTKINSAGGALP